VCVTPVADADPFTEKSTVEDDAAPAAERGDASSPRKRTVFAVDRLPMTIWVVAVAGAAERFAYYSLSAPMRTSTLLPSVLLRQSCLRKRSRYAGS
jgi:hypothetical protein